MTAGQQEDWGGRVRTAYAATLGDHAGVDEEGFPPLTVEVPPDRWTEAVRVARDDLGCGFFDFLSAVDELDHGFRVVCHLAARPTGAGGIRHLLLATRLPRERPLLETVTGLYAGASWHERETHEMFGVDFASAGEVMALEPLLLPEEFEGHPLRKDFVLAARVARPWPGAKEPGESEHDAPAPRRRAGRGGRTGVPGVPTPEEWGPRD